MAVGYYESLMSTIKNLNPSTGELLAEISCATSEEVHDAVARARAAQPAWQALGLEERCRILAGIADGLAARADELADLATKEMGKLRSDAEREVAGFTSMVKAELAEVQEALAPQSFTTDSNVTELVHEHHSKGISLPSMATLREIDHGTEKPSHEGCKSLWMNMDSNSTAEA